MLPGRDGQPVHVQVHVDLATLRGLPASPGGPGGPGAPGLEAGWSPARAAAGPGSVYLSGTDAEAAACDATITPVVSGQIDWTVLDQLTTLFLKAHGRSLDHHRHQPRRAHPAQPRTTQPRGVSTRVMRGQARVAQPHVSRAGAHSPAGALLVSRTGLSK